MPPAAATRRTFLGTLAAAGLAAAPARRPVLLHSGWQTINIGDMGHTLGTLRLFEKYLPGQPVTLAAQSLTPPVEAQIRRRFPWVEVVPGRLPARGAPADDATRAAFAGCGLFVQNSKPSLGPAPFEYARSVGKPYGMYGHSYTPADLAVPGVRDALNAAAFVFCRDSETLALLRAEGVRPGLLEFGPDGCFGIDLRDDDRALAYLRAHGLVERRFITVMLRTNTPKHPTNDDPLNPQRPTPEQKRADEDRAAKLRRAIADWVGRTGMKVLIAPEVDKEIAHNRRLLYDPLPPEVKRSVVVRDTFWLADEAAAVFARAHTVVCHEPHSCVIALAVGTPVLHPASADHGPKRWMFKDVGLGGWLLDLDAGPASAVSDALAGIRADYPAALLQVRRAMNAVEAGQARTMAALGRAAGYV